MLVEECVGNHVDPDSLYRGIPDDFILVVQAGCAEPRFASDPRSVSLPSRNSDASPSLSGKPITSPLSLI